MVQRDSLELKALLVGMKDCPAVPEGWDAVLNLSPSAVQSLVRSDWNSMTLTDEDRPLLWMSPAAVNGQHDLIDVNTDLPLPTIGLNLAKQAVDVSFAIDNGTLRTAKAPAELVSRLGDARSVAGCDEIPWSPPIEITPENPLRLGGTIPVAVDAAADRLSFSIALNLAEGSLALSGHGEDSFSAPAVDRDVAGWLAARRVSHQIGSFALRDSAEATVLTPAAVAARIAPALDGRPVLQILIGASPGAAAAASSEPVPHPDSHDFSLMVSSRATMTSIAGSYNQGTGDIKLISVPPMDGQVHWIARIHQPMVFEGTFGNQDGHIYVTDHSEQYMCFGGSTDQGLKLFTYIDPSSTVRLELDLAAHYPVGISGTGSDQVVGLREGDQSVSGDGFYEAIVKPQLEKFLTGDIRSDMSRVRMDEVSDLVLRDLTLSGHELKFDVAALPGELLVAGSLMPDALARGSREDDR